MATVALWLTRVRGAQANLAWLPLVGLLAGLGSFHFVTLVRVPPPFVDEAWFASHAWGLIHTGHPFGPLDAGVFELYPGYWTYFSYLGAGLLALPIATLGLSVFSVRLVALVFGLVLLAAIGRIASRLFGERTGFVAVTLVGISQAFLYASHLARPDIVVAAAGYGAIALTLSEARPSVPWRSFLGGLALGLAFEVHPNAMLYGPVIIGLLLLDHGRSVWRSRQAWAFVIGALAGLAVFVSLHLVHYPQTFFQLTSLTFGTTKTPPVLIPALWLQSSIDTLMLMTAFGTYTLPVLAVGLGWLVKNRLPADIRIVTIFGLLVGQFVLLVSYKPPYYPIYLMPAADLVLAVWLVRLTESKWHGSLRTMLSLALAWGLTIAAALTSVAQVRDQPMDGYQTTIARIREVVPPGSVLMGEPRYWFGLADYRFFAWQQLTYYRDQMPGSSLDEALRWHRPDYFLLDSLMELQIVDDPSHMEAWAQRLSLNKTEFDKFMAERGQIVADIDAQARRSVRVIRITWE